MIEIIRDLPLVFVAAWFVVATIREVFEKRPLTNPSEVRLGQLARFRYHKPRPLWTSEDESWFQEAADAAYRRLNRQVSWTIVGVVVGSVWSVVWAGVSR